MLDLNPFRYMRSMLEIAANRLLVMTDQPDLLASLNGKVIEINLKGLGRSLYIAIINDSLSVFERWDKNIDVSVVGTPMALIKLLMQDDIMMLLQSGEIEMLGDVRLGRKLKRLFSLGGIDWEEVSVQAMGDMPAYQFHKMLNVFMQGAGLVKSSVQDNVSEFLQEEARYLPSAIEVKNFMKDVDVLRDDVQRLIRRIQNIETAVGQQ